MSEYDIMQVCLNGHKITGTYLNTSKLRQSTCEECGADTIHKCPECDTPIQGDSVGSKQVAPTRRPVPYNCQFCGEPYPWNEEAVGEPYLNSSDREWDMDIPYHFTEFDVRQQSIKRPLRGDYSDNIKPTVFSSAREGAEVAATKFYEQQGYNVVDLSYGTSFDSLVEDNQMPASLRDELERYLLNEYERTYTNENHQSDTDFFEPFDSPLEFVENSGLPDLLIYDEDDSFFFVEVKSEDDHLRRTQLEWFFEFECYSARVLYVDEYEPKESLMDL